MKIEVYRRVDNTWAWRVKAGNGDIIATDGGQGYANKQDAVDMLHTLFGQQNHLDISFGDENEVHLY